ncbi:transposase [Sphingomonas antarctica]|uniref:IS66-like element accessory protein TnpA n=1 Tax=Sphingomonas antarctica TaxID=2040274 RepID=UPI0039EB224D
MADDETLYETLMTSLIEGVPGSPRSERRRSWHPQQKMAIVQESCTSGASPTQVARRYGISTGLLYTWRKQLLTAATDGFIRCEVITEPAAALPAPVALSPPPALPVPAAVMSGTIEVELPGGTRLRLGGDVDAGALARVIDVLRR